MVTNVTSLTGNGLKDWIIQRLTAVYFAIFSIGLLCFLVGTPGLTYERWHDLFHCSMIKILFIIALFAFALHAWIGLWTVTTDYLKKTAVRLWAQSMILFILLVECVGGILMVWGQ